ncbi:major royal jelly protein 1-like [Hetaerina americana]|uniref:major royal jelly protein 1-like n=1 Tax=Hetaerina americana TaxID=62018 RepID=UPI003A7F3FF1
MAHGVPWTWRLALALALAATGTWRNSVVAEEAENVKLEEVYGWKVLDYAWPTEESRDEARINGTFIPKNNIIISAKTWGDRMYITVPRWLPGVPSTLNWVPYNVSELSTDGEPLSPPLNPFPSWEMQEVGNCSALQFVQSMEIDPLGRMWVLDVGRRNIFSGSPDNSCPPKLVLLDLQHDNRVLHTFTFPDDVVSHTNNFINDLVIDVSDGGEGYDWYAYISDPQTGQDNGGGIVVYHLGTDRAWRVSDWASMNYESGEASEVYIEGERSVLRMNVDGIGLSPLAEGADKLFYAPLGSFNLYYLPTAILRNQSAESLDVTRAVVDLGPRTSQGGGMAVDSTGALYLGLLGQESIARWSHEAQVTVGDPYEAEVLAIDPDRLQGIDGFGFDNDNKYLFIVFPVQEQD